ncbi:MAG: hypothetical protein QG621_655 [Patescibacteria group bacterium]|nr:hypothetical protein [Patescibacteria group bacterium]
MFVSDSRQVSIVHQNINSLVALVFVASFAGGVALIIWHACIGNNPIADFLVQTSITRQALQY